MPSPTLALTFDDGPSESTPRLLELLARHGVTATFFQCGANVRRLPGVAREVAAAGHEIGNHGDSHRLLAPRSVGFIYEELARAQQSITEITGQAPVWFRPPYGVRWFGLRAAERKLGLTTVMWDVIGRDWKLPAEGIVRRVLRAAARGGIICLHDGRETRPDPDIRAMLEALARLLPELQAQGYHPTTVTENRSA